jgi:hypothetical protein
MSFLVLGHIQSGPQTRQPIIPLKQFLFQTVEQAAEQNLYIAFGYNIAQPLALEILGHKTEPIVESHLPFLLTGSPLESTSDELIFPSSLDQSTAAYRTHLKSRLSAVEAVISHIMTNEHILGVALIFTSAFDTSYPTEKCAARDVSAISYEHIRRDGFFSGFRLEIASE